MRASAFMAGETFARLRRRIAEIEGRGAGFGDPWEPSLAEPGAPFPDGFAPSSPLFRETSAQSASAPRAFPPPIEAGGKLQRVSRNPGESGDLHLLGPRWSLPRTAIRGGDERDQDEQTAALSPRRAGSLLPFAISRLDRMLAGGLRRDALHEIRVAASREAAAATGFAAAVLARLAEADDRPILWIVEAAASHEAGLPYGAGLDRFGLDSGRLIIVRVHKPGDALWVFEEGLSCRGLAAVLTEIRGRPRLLDLTASRRLALRARDGGVMGLFLRQTDQAEPGAALTRWLVAPRPAATLDDYPAGIGRPVWRLTLERNRLGATGVFDVEWDHGRRCFAPAGGALEAAGPAYSLPVAAVSSDRPHLAPGQGAVVA